MTNNPLTQAQILDYLKSIKQELENDGIVKLGLFGSYAKNKADIASDIDIVICSTNDFVAKYGGFGALAYLGDLRERVKKQFGVEVDICDVASMPQERKDRLLNGAIYV